MKNLNTIKEYLINLDVFHATLKMGATVDNIMQERSLSAADKHKLLAQILFLTLGNAGRSKDNTDRASMIIQSFFASCIVNNMYVNSHKVNLSFVITQCTDSSGSNSLLESARAVARAEDHKKEALVLFELIYTHISVEKRLAALRIKDQVGSNVLTFIAEKDIPHKKLWEFFKEKEESKENNANNAACEEKASPTLT